MPDGTLPVPTPYQPASTEDVGQVGTEESESSNKAESSTSQAVAVRKSPLSASEKTELLRERERRWSQFDAAREEKLRVKGPAGVYELQEGIFLMCNDYSHLDEGRVSRSLPAAVQAC